MATLVEIIRDAAAAAGYGEDDEGIMLDAVLEYAAHLEAGNYPAEAAYLNLRNGLDRGEPYRLDPLTAVELAESIALNAETTEGTDPQATLYKIAGRTAALGNTHGERLAEDRERERIRRAA